jgi:hypothetical protein
MDGPPLPQKKKKEPLKILSRNRPLKAPLPKTRPIEKEVPMQFLFSLFVNALILTVTISLLGPIGGIAAWVLVVIVSLMGS